MGERAALNAAEAEFLRGVLDDPPDEREWQASRGLPHGGSDAEPSSSAHERSFGGSWQRDHEAGEGCSVCLGWDVGVGRWGDRPSMHAHTRKHLCMHGLPHACMPT
eukprot:363303-Chlamydomonas_euryale.AAC.7